jgi:hypothetical protein
MRRTVIRLVVVWAMLGAAGAVRAQDGRDAANTLILALDGVPYHVVVEARARGAFAGWGEPRPLVSTFPSMTNVGFVAILDPLGSSPMRGYELRHYDYEKNRVTGSGLGSARKQAGAWRVLFDASSNSLWSKLEAFLCPRHEARQEIRRIERLVLEQPAERMLGLVGATDSALHLGGDEPVIRLLLELSDRLAELRRRHEELHGRPLRVVILSDHGNGGGKVRTTDGLRRTLRDAGLRPAQRLGAPEDVVLVTYGVCGYGALYMSHDHAERAARACVAHEGIDLAAWIEGPERLRVVGRAGDAVVRWRVTGPERELAYETGSGDPLRQAGAVDALRAAGRADADGFATESAWFEATAALDYPHALARLVDALDGRWVENAATVLLSFEPGYALGLRTARAGAWLLGGRVEATHGGLDRISTWGVYVRSDDDGRPAAPVRADVALAEWGVGDDLVAALPTSPWHRPRGVP